MVWLWPGIREGSKRWYLGSFTIYTCIIGYLIFVMTYVVFISSPNLFVFSDDRVRGTREQRMLIQVEPVMLSHRVGFYWGNFLCFLYMLLETVVKPDG